jgi:hypothetical protein
MLGTKIIPIGAIFDTSVPTDHCKHSLLVEHANNDDDQEPVVNRANYSLALLLLGGWYLWGLSGGNLTSLNQSNFAQFTARFDAAANDERILLLLSPT